LNLTHKFGVLLNEINVSAIKKVLPNLDCAACGSNEEIHIAADGNFKLSRLKSHNLLSVDPQINNFFVSNYETKELTKNVATRVPKDDLLDNDACASVFAAATPNRRKAGKIHDETEIRILD